MSDKDLNKKIKQSFESSSDKAPEELWENISEKLDNRKEDHSAMDQKIKESFENHKTKAPDEVWKGVNRKLNIDRTWNKIRNRLDRIKLYQTLRRIAAVMLLLIGLTWTLESQFFQKNEKSETPSSGQMTAVEDLSEDNTIQQMVDQKNNSRKNDDITHHASAKKNEPNLEKSASREDIQKRKKAEVPPLEREKETGKKAVNPGSFALATDHQPEKEEKTVKEAPQKTSKSSSEEQGMSNALADTEDKAPENLREEAGKLPEQKTSKAADKSGKINAIVEYAPGKKLSYMEPLPPRSQENKKVADLSKLLREEPSTIAVKDEKTNPTSFELGIFYAMNYTGILNNDTRKSFEETSLITSEAVITGNCGFKFDYWFNDKHGINTILYSRSVNQHNYSTYSEGDFITKKLSLEYYQVNINYSYNLSSNPDNRIRNIINAGPYISLLKTGKVNIEGKEYSIEDDYRKIDHGINLSFTQELEIMDDLWFGYGVHAEKGLINIHGQNHSTPSESSRTTLQNAGIHLQAKYSF